MSAAFYITSLVRNETKQTVIRKLRNTFHASEKIRNSLTSKSTVTIFWNNISYI